MKYSIEKGCDHLQGMGSQNIQHTRADGKEEDNVVLEGNLINCNARLHRNKNSLKQIHFVPTIGYVI